MVSWDFFQLGLKGGNRAGFGFERLAGGFELGGGCFRRLALGTDADLEVIRTRLSATCGRPWIFPRWLRGFSRGPVAGPFRRSARAWWPWRERVWWPAPRSGPAEEAGDGGDDGKLREEPWKGGEHFVHDMVGEITREFACRELLRDAVTVNFIAMREFPGHDGGRDSRSSVAAMLDFLNYLGEIGKLVAAVWDSLRPR